MTGKDGYVKYYATRIRRFNLWKDLPNIELILSAENCVSELSRCTSKPVCNIAGDEFKRYCRNIQMQVFDQRDENHLISSYNVQNVIRAKEDVDAMFGKIGRSKKKRTNPDPTLSKEMMLGFLSGRIEAFSGIEVSKVYSVIEETTNVIPLYMIYYPKQWCLSPKMVSDCYFCGEVFNLCSQIAGRVGLSVNTVFTIFEYVQRTFDWCGYPTTE